MNVKLSIAKKGVPLYEGEHRIIDKQSFAAAFGEAWQAIHQRQLEAATSVGEAMDIINDEVLEQLQGAEIRIETASPRSA